MGVRYLIDSNMLIKYQGNLLPERPLKEVTSIIDIDFNISVISELEVLGHTSADDNLKEFIGLANVYNITDKVKEMTIAIRKNYRTKLPDAIIAATAIANKFTLLTQNSKDFRNIAGLSIYDPSAE